VLTTLIVVIVAGRAVLWFTTDLIWNHTVVGNEVATYGPLREPLMVVVAILLLILVFKTMSRPWIGLLSRGAVVSSMAISIVFAGLMNLSRGVIADLFALAVLATPVVAVQSALLVGLRRRARAAELQSEREARLADFGTAALARGAVVPTQLAVDMLSSLLHPAQCRYHEYEASESSTAPGFDADRDFNGVTTIVVPVEASGRPVGEISVRGELTPDDAVFCRSVGITLSAALTRADIEQTLRDGTVRDSLTSLPNWALLQDRLKQLINSKDRQSAVVICCDVVDMQGINDEFGHDIGDEVLRALGDRLVTLTDVGGTVSRIGSDEFVIAQAVPDVQTAEILCEEVASIRSLHVGEGQEVPVSMRAGMAISHGEREDPDRFVRDAELALMQAKSESVAVYNSEARDAVFARRRLSRDLAVAVRAGEITVDYQPIVLLATGQVVGVEALARWRPSAGRIVAPSVFIPVAEQEGLIMEVTRQVFSQAISQLARWGERDSFLANMSLSVNLTAKVAEEPTFTAWLRDELAVYQIDPGRITVELTETVVEDATTDLLQVMRDLADLGVSISLDDFGTGYSSLTRLMSLPVAELKIDSTFVSAAPGPHRAIIRMVIGLAKNSNLNVVAEGIEDEEEYMMLRGAGCSMGQGYHFSRPVAGERIPAIVHAAAALRTPRPNSA
jgi:diguanylate cyclase (GGDEF)-like protein